MKLVRLDKADFDYFSREIERGFISDEYREYNEAKKLFLDGKYDVFCLKISDTYIGFISIWQLSSFAFAEHFVVKEQYRNNGVGKEMLSLITGMFDNVVLEAEPPVSDIQVRRLNFYKRNGFLENEGEYYQPAYKEDSGEVRLVIMSYPNKLPSFFSVCDEIKRKVYFK